ncbi:hypothetical protein [Xenorhabdus ishibashii]|uniref:hypothetical protein n=1 Tax=Xenorhabdus ishibashii TaxID=1034471 RepID=UPI00142E5991|nr:hypothetical protein [Xenorhabdus ishibashii]
MVEQNQPFTDKRGQPVPVVIGYLFQVVGDMHPVKTPFLGAGVYYCDSYLRRVFTNAVSITRLKT